MNRREFVFSSACACLAVAAARIELARATSASHYRCGTWPPTPSEDIQATRVIEALRAHRVTFRGKTVIPVRFHIIHVGAQGYRATPTPAQSSSGAAQSHLCARGARLHDCRCEAAENKAWFTHEPGSPAEIEMKTELGKDTARTPISTRPSRAARCRATRPSRGREPPRPNATASSSIMRAFPSGPRRTTPRPSFPAWRPCISSATGPAGSLTPSRTDATRKAPA